MNLTRSALGCNLLFMFLLIKQITIRINISACAVDITLYQQTEYGVIHTVVRPDLLDAGINRCSNKLSNTDFINMSVLRESNLNILHVCATTSQDDATQQFIVVFSRNLITDILDNLLYASLDNLNEATSFYLTVRIDRVFHLRINIIIIRIGRTIIQFHLLGITLLHLK